VQGAPIALRLPNDLLSVPGRRTDSELRLDEARTILEEVKKQSTHDTTFEPFLISVAGSACRKPLVDSDWSGTRVVLKRPLRHRFSMVEFVLDDEPPTSSLENKRRLQKETYASRAMIYRQHSARLDRDLGKFFGADLRDRNLTVEIPDRFAVR